MLDIRSVSVAVFAAGAVAVVLTTARFGLRAAHGAHAAQAGESFQPFTATVFTRGYDGRGNPVGTKVALWAMRSDGSMARLLESYNDRPSGIRTVFDLSRS